MNVKIFPKKRTLEFVLILVVLNCIINIAELWRKPWHEKFFYPSPEATILIIFMMILVKNKIKSHSLIPILSIAFIGAVFFRWADSVAFYFFSRKFNFYNDIGYLPDFIHFIYHSSSKWIFYPKIAFFALLIYGSFQATKRMLIRLACHLEQKKHRKMIGYFAVFLLTLGLSGIPVFSSSLSWRIYEEALFVWNLDNYKAQFSDKVQAAATKLQNVPSNLNRLKSKNVYLVLVESYGATVLEKPEHFDLIQATYENFEKTLREEGFFICSNLIDSPTFAGKSWLAHSTLTCGIEITDEIMFDQLLLSQASCITSFFKQAGYKTIAAKPANVWPWPQGKFFGFDKTYNASNFQYKGPRYGWATMPDQYVLDFIYHKDIKTAQQPLFIEYVLISSHAHFNILPTYIPDWSLLGNGAIFHNYPTRTFPLSPKNAAESYITAITYEFEVLQGYLQEYINDDSLFIILGDHQPHAQLTGKQASFAVPIHIISRSYDSIETFQKRSYTPGIIPKQKAPFLKMEDFLFSFLEDFSEK